MMGQGGIPARMGYYDNYLIDNASCVLVGVQATAARMSQETVAAQDMLTRFNKWQRRVPELVMPFPDVQMLASKTTPKELPPKSKVVVRFASYQRRRATCSGFLAEPVTPLLRPTCAAAKAERNESARTLTTLEPTDFDTTPLLASEFPECFASRACFGLGGVEETPYVECGLVCTARQTMSRTTILTRSIGCAIAMFRRLT